MGSDESLNRTVWSGFIDDETVSIDCLLDSSMDDGESFTYHAFNGAGRHIGPEFLRTVPESLNDDDYAEMAAEAVDDE